MAVLVQADGGVREGIHIDNSNTKVSKSEGSTRAVSIFHTENTPQSQTITSSSHLNDI